MRERDYDKPEHTSHRRISHRPGTVDDHRLSHDDDELDRVDKEIADSFPASDPPSHSSPGA